MKKRYIPFIFISLLAALACNLGSASPAETPVSSIVTDSPAQPQDAPPTFTPIVTFTSAPPPTPRLSEVISLQFESFSESGLAPKYIVTAQIPFVTGVDPSRLAGFNTLLRQAADEQIKSFRDSTVTLAPVDPVTTGSSFDLRYALTGQKLDYWSIKYDISAYFDGAAHPGHYSVTINYDLDRNHPLTLDDLFLPGSNYLQVVSDYCKAELSARDIAFEAFSGGANPLPENYQRWNLSHEGLVITFDEYQVAPYAAGPQVVVIPISALGGVTDPGGILSLFVQ